MEKGATSGADLSTCGVVYNLQCAWLESSIEEDSLPTCVVELWDMLNPVC